MTSDMQRYLDTDNASDADYDEHEDLHKEPFCSGYIDEQGGWHSGFTCPLPSGSLVYRCCGAKNTRHCCATIEPSFAAAAANVISGHGSLVLVIGVVSAVVVTCILLTLTAFLLYKLLRLHRKQSAATELCQMQCASSASVVTSVMSGSLAGSGSMAPVSCWPDSAPVSTNNNTIDWPAVSVSHTETALSNSHHWADRGDSRPTISAYRQSLDCSDPGVFSHTGISSLSSDSCFVTTTRDHPAKERAYRDMTGWHSGQDKCDGENVVFGRQSNQIVAACPPAAHKPQMTADQPPQRLKQLSVEQLMTVARLIEARRDGIAQAQSQSGKDSQRLHQRGSTAVLPLNQLGKTSYDQCNINRGDCRFADNVSRNGSVCSGSGCHSYVSGNLRSRDSDKNKAVGSNNRSISSQDTAAWIPVATQCYASWTDANSSSPVVNEEHNLEASQRIENVVEYRQSTDQAESLNIKPMVSKSSQTSDIQHYSPATL